MLNENAKKWVAALRSGKYRQGRTRLRRADDRYCCLGVACAVAMEHGVDLTVELVPAQHEYVIGGKTDYLPESVRRWLGLRTVAGSYAMNASLVTLNDDYMKSFNEIADFIEKEPEGLFVEEQ